MTVLASPSQLPLLPAGDRHRGRGRWRASWRVAGRLAVRDARRDRRRTALIAALIGLPALLGSAGGVLLTSGTPTAARRVQVELGPTVQARVSGFVGAHIRQDPTESAFGWVPTGGDATTRDLAAYTAALQTALPAGSALHLRLDASGRASTTTTSAVVDVVEADLGDPDVAAIWPLASGRYPSAAGEVVVTPSLARHLGVRAGDRVVVDAGRSAGPAAVTVVGLTAPRPGQSTRPAVLGASGADLVDPPTSTQRTTRVSASWLVTGSAPVGWSAVQAVNALGSTVLSRQVVLHPPASRDRGAVPTSSAGSGLDLALVAVVAAFGLVVAVFVIGPAFAVGARRDVRRLALVAACGGDRRDLSRVVLATGAVLGLGASAAGAGAGVALGAVVRAVVQLRDRAQLPDLRVPWPMVAGAVVVGALIALVAAWLPARTAGRTDVVAALAGRRVTPRPRRRVWVAGAALVVLGGSAGAFGGALRVPAAQAVGVVAMVGGAVMAAGALVVLVARVSPLLGSAGRFALRDAVRQHTRTTPAVAAVLVAVAALVATATYLSCQDAQRRATYGPVVADGRVVVTWDPWQGRDAAWSTVRPGVVAAVRAALPVDQVLDVSLAASSSQQAGAVSTVQAQMPAGHDCPQQDLDGSRSGLAAARADPRCARDLVPKPMIVGGTGWSRSDVSTVAVVDDGTVVRASGLAGSAPAAAALAAGRVLVADQRLLADDGTVRLDVGAIDRTGAVSTAGSVDLPATAVDLGSPAWDLVLPPATLDRLGLQAVDGGLLVTTTAMPTAAQQDEAQASLAAISGALRLRVERGLATDLSMALAILLAVATVLVLGAGAIAVALAQVEARADLATIAAIGAPPSVRRRVAAAQAGAIVGVGAVTGAPAGLLLAWVVVLQRRYGSTVPDLSWALHVPWPAVGAAVVLLPALAIAGTWLVTPARVPPVRRSAV